MKMRGAPTQLFIFPDMIKKLKDLLLQRWLYVIVDSSDSSITLSPILFKRMGGKALSGAKALVFRMSPSGKYAFTINPDVGEGALLADIQYNYKYKTIGFETLIPTVSRILFDYGLAEGRMHILHVTTTMVNDMEIFVMNPPRSKK